MHGLEAEKGTLLDDDNKLEVFFKQMIQMCLWRVLSVMFMYYPDTCIRGNATVPQPHFTRKYSD